MDYMMTENANLTFKGFSTIFRATDWRRPAESAISGSELLLMDGFSSMMVGFSFMVVYSMTMEETERIENPYTKEGFVRRYRI